MEACLVEVPCKMKMLRSRTSFVLLNLEDVDKDKASIHIWHGVKSSEVTRKTAKFAAEKLKELWVLEEMELFSVVFPVISPLLHIYYCPVLYNQLSISVSELNNDNNDNNSV